MPKEKLPEPFNRFVNDLHCYNEVDAVVFFTNSLLENRQYRFLLSELIVKHNSEAAKPTEGPEGNKTY